MTCDFDMSKVPIDLRQMVSSLRFPFSLAVFLCGQRSQCLQVKVHKLESISPFPNTHNKIIITIIIIIIIIIIVIIIIIINYIAFILSHSRNGNKIASAHTERDTKKATIRLLR